MTAILSPGIAAIVLLSATSAAAQSTPSPASPPAGAQDTDHDHHDGLPGDIVITAPLQTSLAEQLSGTTVLRGEELVRELRPTIGDTLQRQPGMSATSFGPNASRPVLRGLQGERVRVLTDGIGSFDVSNTSVDHAVAINPLTADRIEILRGPSALLFGSSAIGGVVNVIDSRIPRRVPRGFHVDGLATYGSAADERSASAALDMPIGGQVVVHLDGSYGRTDDLRTGGFILSAPLRARAAASDDPEAAALADARGRLDNSASERWEIAGGAAIVNARGSLGFSVAHMENRYGVPNRPGLDEAHDDHDHDHDEEGHEHGDIQLDMRQTRFDIRGELLTGGGFLDRLRLRTGVADYRHDEIEPSGEIGTTFRNQGFEARVEAVQARRGGWRGAFGGQLLIRDFEAIGEEKFVPRNETLSYGLFTVQSLDLGRFRLEAGGRYEHSIAIAQPDADLGNPFIRRSFDAVSGSLGGSIALAGDLRLGLNATHSQRAPSAEELYANGPHAGTQAFEIGDPDFAKERATGIEATLRGSGEGWQASLSAYHNWFDGYIYQQPTGEEQDGLPVFLYQQADARLYGFEAEASARLARLGTTAIVVDGVADYTRATIRRVGPAPLIPPLRLLGGVEAQAAVGTARIEVEHVFEQDRVTDFELPTDGFTMVNAAISARPFGARSPVALTLSANNIFDVAARRHASLAKDFAPLAGRDIRISARVAF